jgi:hypothetical protein
MNNLRKQITRFICTKKHCTQDTAMNGTAANGRSSSSSQTIVYGVELYPCYGIKVTMNGAGVGGLFRALECWPKGCEVVVLERQMPSHRSVSSEIRHKTSASHAIERRRLLYHSIRRLLYAEVLPYHVKRVSRTIINIGI